MTNPWQNRGNSDCERSERRDGTATRSLAPRQRAGLDRNADDLDNGFETNAGVFVSASDTGSNPGLADSDGDGFSDGEEVHAGSDPNDPTSGPAAVVPVLSTWVDRCSRGDGRGGRGARFAPAPVHGVGVARPSDPAA